MNKRLLFYGTLAAALAAWLTTMATFGTVFPSALDIQVHDTYFIIDARDFAFRVWLAFLCVVLVVNCIREGFSKKSVAWLLLVMDITIISAYWSIGKILFITKGSGDWFTASFSLRGKISFYIAFLCSPYGMPLLMLFSAALYLLWRLIKLKSQHSTYDANAPLDTLPNEIEQ